MHPFTPPGNDPVPTVFVYCTECRSFQERADIPYRCPHCGAVRGVVQVTAHIRCEACGWQGWFRERPHCSVSTHTLSVLEIALPEGG